MPTTAEILGEHLKEMRDRNGIVATTTLTEISLGLGVAVNSGDEEAVTSALELLLEIQDIIRSRDSLSNHERHCLEMVDRWLQDLRPQFIALKSAKALRVLEDFREQALEALNWYPGITPRSMVTTERFIQVIRPLLEYLRDEKCIEWNGEDDGRIVLTPTQAQSRLKK
jgi:hypothetical protein